MFEEIKEKCPKGWEMFLEYYFNESEIRFQIKRYGSVDKLTQQINEVDFESLIGWLFRFFDEQGIHIDIFADFNDSEHRLTGFGFLIWHKVEGGEGYYWTDNSGGTYCKSRTEAWKAAFIKSFEILEEK